MAASAAAPARLSAAISAASFTRRSNASKRDAGVNVASGSAACRLSRCRLHIWSLTAILRAPRRHERAHQRVGVLAVGPGLEREEGRRGARRRRFDAGATITASPLAGSMNSVSRSDRCV